MARAARCGCWRWCRQTERERGHHTPGRVRGARGLRPAGAGFRPSGARAVHGRLSRRRADIGPERAGPRGRAVAVRAHTGSAARTGAGLVRAAGPRHALRLHRRRGPGPRAGSARRRAVARRCAPHGRRPPLHLLRAPAGAGNGGWPAAGYRVPVAAAAGHRGVFPSRTVQQADALDHRRRTRGSWTLRRSPRACGALRDGNDDHTHPQGRRLGRPTGRQRPMVVTSLAWASCASVNPAATRPSR